MHSPSLPKLPLLGTLAARESSYAAAFAVAGQTLGSVMVALEKELMINPPELLPWASQLLSQLRQCYTSYLLLTWQHDQLGSQILLERLREIGIMVIYLLEAPAEEVLADYVYDALQQSHYLQKLITQQLKDYPEHHSLLRLQEQLIIFQTQFMPLTSDQSMTGTLNQYASELGFAALTNPARELRLTVRPGSALDMHLQQTTNLTTAINFTEIREVSHLCLYAAQLLLEVGFDSETDLFQLLTTELNQLFVWFYEAHQAYYRGQFLPQDPMLGEARTGSTTHTISELTNG